MCIWDSNFNWASDILPGNSAICWNADSPAPLQTDWIRICTETLRYELWLMASSSCCAWSPRSLWPKPFTCVLKQFMILFQKAQRELYILPKTRLQGCTEPELQASSGFPTGLRKEQDSCPGLQGPHSPSAFPLSNHLPLLLALWRRTSLFAKHTKPVPTSGPLHLLFIWPKHSASRASRGSLLKSCLPRKLLLWSYLLTYASLKLQFSLFLTLGK